MDPQQRLLLCAALEALEDSGYAPDATETFQRDSFGVYIGVATGDYVDNLRDDIDVYYSPGKAPCCTLQILKTCLPSLTHCGRHTSSFPQWTRFVCFWF
jgi:3-oxoacyl-(acyl-carrier-protein) synthase